MAIMELLDDFSSFADECARFSGRVRQETAGRYYGASRPVLLVERKMAKTIFGTWNREIAEALSKHSPLSFRQLKKAVGPVSDRMLSLNLKRTAEFGLVGREVIASNPPKVMYTLNEFGRTLTRMSQPIFLYLHIIQSFNARPTPQPIISYG